MFTAFNSAFTYRDVDMNTPERVDFRGVAGIEIDGRLLEDGEASLDITSGAIDFYTSEGEMVHTIYLIEKEE